VIIRLEMAYPGVGILAGDSLQYLSVVTAHAVIMVFFYVNAFTIRGFWKFFVTHTIGSS
jgi:cytochrome c oxidase subunit 1